MVQYARSFLTPNTMKKLFALLVCGALLILSAPLLSSASESTGFSDLDFSDPAYDAIDWMQTNGIVEGYEDGTFQSLNKINRAEFMKIVVESITDEATGSFCFPDVNDEWFAKYVCYGHEMGLVDGYPDGTFQPANEINFAEASKIVTNALGLELTETETGDPWYRAYVEPLAELNAVPLSISDLDKSIARGEMAEVIWRVEEDMTDLDSLNYEELEGELVQVSSCAELKELFLSDPPDYYYWDEDDVVMMDEPIAAVEDGGSTESESKSVESSSSSDEYSETNVQVEGVDEADIVKTDGQYIYLIRNYTVTIVEAHPQENLEKIIEMDIPDFEFTPEELYVDGDQLVIVGTTYNYGDYDYGFEPMFWGYHEDRAAAYIYDISDPSAPVLERFVEFDGYYHDSRKVDDTLYLIINKWDYYDLYYYDYTVDEVNIEELVPLYYDSKTGEEEQIVQCGDIRYVPRERELNYTIAAAIPLDDPNGEIDKEVIVGNSENIYSSRDNLYLASTNYDSDNYYYDWNNAKTLVHRFSLDGGELEYADSGKVPGTILNQFSMDEYDDHFRIATTEGSFWSEAPSSNNLYVLNMDLDVTGSVERLAPGETIYSTRFMGDTGYIVTFKKIDPLFVLDLSDPYNPIVKGELKIPGYSDYLHPFGDDYLIGFGKDAEDPEEEETWLRDMDFAWYQGMKISLFDVSDLENPIQVDSVGIGDRGTESELLYNHKALMFDEAKGLIAFPIEVAIVEDPNAPANTYGETVFQGAYVYDFDESGFSFKGMITHYGEEFADSDAYWYYYNWDKEVLRILYIGDTLYTVAEGSIKASDLDTLEELNYLDLW